ncbi:MAG: hypothetical protein VKN33_04435 [Candidatus Sericytochromatia bacterium]|nr:hypothetical protein [Candidatus Sericytochromatia bacterium]
MPVAPALLLSYSEPGGLSVRLQPEQVNTILREVKQALGLMRRCGDTGFGSMMAPGAGMSTC